MVFLEAGVRNFCDCVASNVHCFGMKGYIYPDQRECWWSADGCANCMYMKQKWRGPILLGRLVAGPGVLSGVSFP